jgi:hypothetical protein
MSSTFYNTLLLTTNECYASTIFIVLMCACIFVVDSIFFERYSTSALILIPAYEDANHLERRALDVQTNERFLATQQTAIFSDKVLKKALAISRPDTPINSQMLDSLKQNLSIERLPFNNTITLRLKGSDPNQIQQVLGTIIESYDNWFQDSITTDTVRLRESLRSELETEEEQLNSAEKTLNTFDDEYQASFLAERHAGTAVQLDDIDERIHKTKQRIARLEATQSMIDSTTEGLSLTVSECLQQTDAFYHKSNRPLAEFHESELDLRRHFSSDAYFGHKQINDKFFEVVIMCVFRVHTWLPPITHDRLFHWVTDLIALSAEKSHLSRLQQQKTTIQEHRKYIASLEQKRKPIARAVEHANDCIRQTREKIRHLDWLIARNSGISVEIMTPPTEPLLTNPLSRNIFYGFATGLSAGFLLIYLLALRTHRRAHC